MRSATAVNSEEFVSPEPKGYFRVIQKKKPPVISMGEEELGLLDVVFLDAIDSHEAALNR